MKGSRSSIPARTSFRLLCVLIPLIGMIFSGTLAGNELDYQIHGFGSQGYIKTSGNDFYGDSTDGSFDYYEVGLNGIVSFNPSFSISGQILAREAGEPDDGDVRVDYAFLDYQMITLETSRAGARLGRVRNPLGFYNESRDVLFTRPSILLPQSIYLEGTGVRELLFSSDGVQFYGDWDHDAHHTAFKLNIAIDEDVSSTTRNNFTGGGASIGGLTVNDMTLNSPLYMQILHEHDGGKMRYALSYLEASLEATFSVGPFIFPPATIDSELVILSAQYNAEKWSLTSEYNITTTEFNFSGMTGENKSDGMYLQGEYRFTPQWTGLLRYDVTYANRNDRGDTDSRDTTLGFTWKFHSNWILMGEFHNIDGTSGIPRSDNPVPSAQLDPRTKLYALMLGFRF